MTKLQEHAKKAFKMPLEQSGKVNYVLAKVLCDRFVSDGMKDISEINMKFAQMAHSESLPEGFLVPTQGYIAKAIQSTFENMKQQGDR